MNVKHFFMTLALCCAMSQLSAQSIESAIDSLETNPTYSLSVASKIIKSDAKNVDAYVVRGQANTALENYAQALSDFGEALKRLKKQAHYSRQDILICRAETYALVEDTVSALADYATALTCGDPIKVYEKRADFYYHIENYTAAEKDYRILLENNPNDADLQLIIADCMTEQERYDEAMTMLNKLIRYQPRIIAAYKQRAYVAYYMGKNEQAIDDYIHFMEKDDKYSFYRFSLIARRNYTYAIRQLNARISATSSSMVLQGARIFIYIDQKKYELALSSLETFEKEYGSMAFINYQRARCYNGTYHFKEAITEYDKLIETMSSPDADIYLERGIAHRNMEHMDEAIEDFTTSIRVEPSVDAYLQRGLTNEYKGNTTAALEDYNTAISNDSEVEDAYFLKGKLLLAKGDTLHGIEQLEIYLSLDSTDWNAACVYAILGKSKVVNQMLSGSSLEYDYQFYNAACAMSLLGEGDKAMQYLNKAVELGYKNYVDLKYDSDLNAIRQRSDFQALLEKLQGEKVSKLFQSLKTK